MKIALQIRDANGHSMDFHKGVMYGRLAEQKECMKKLATNKGSNLTPTDYSVCPPDEDDIGANFEPV